MTEERRTPDINWVQAVAGALAAMSSAVLLSTVGVAGTLIGAAVGSVVATVGGAVYSHYLVASKQRIANAHAAAAARVSRARFSVSGAADDVDERAERAGQELDQARRELEHAEQELRDARVQPGAFSWRDTLTRLPWKRILVTATGIFLAVMLLILVFELATGRAVSTYTGGSDDNGPRTSIPGWGGDDRSGREEKPGPDEEEPTPAPGTEQGEPSPTGQDSPEEAPVPPGPEAPSPAPTASGPTTPEPTTPQPTTAEPTPAEPTPAEPTPTAPLTPLEPPQ